MTRNGFVTVAMDASKGSLNAADLWRNDIAGAGKLTLQGTGTLTLAGNNSYTGGTQVSGGRLRVGGPLTVAGGTLHVKFVNGYAPKAGDTIALIDGAAGSAKFSTVTVDGFKATPVYTSSGVSITLSAA